MSLPLIIKSVKNKKNSQKIHWTGEESPEESYHYFFSFINKGELSHAPAGPGRTKTFPAG